MTTYSNLLKSIKNSFNYKIKTQEYLEAFLSDYKNNNNSTPLDNLFRLYESDSNRLKDLQMIKRYIKQITNIQAFSTNEKDNLKIVLKKDESFNYTLPSKAWYEYSKDKKDKKDYYSDAKGAFNGIKTFVEKIEKCFDKVGLNDNDMQYIHSIYNKLQSLKELEKDNKD